MSVLYSSPMPLAAASSNPPLHQLAYEKIRDMILYGDLAPGQPITIHGLVSSLGLGMTPVREAIRRLTAEGALQSTDTRRVLVPLLHVSQLDELSYLRLAIEPHLARLAAERISPGAIDGLEAIDKGLNDAIGAGDVQSYLRLNYAFHRTLYAHSDSEIALSMADTLWLRAGPSLRVVCGRYGTLNLPDMHEETIAALRKRDSDAAASAIAADIRQGHSQIRRSLSEA